MKREYETTATEAICMDVCVPAQSPLTYSVNEIIAILQRTHDAIDRINTTLFLHGQSKPEPGQPMPIKGLVDQVETIQRLSEGLHNRVNDIYLALGEI